MTDTERESFSRSTSLGYQVNHLARLFGVALHRRIAPLGVVPGQERDPDSPAWQAADRARTAGPQAAGRPARGGAAGTEERETAAKI
jgi:hypothetical protein